MRKMLIIGAALIALAGAVHAHLCNDVFAQAKDNLAVKVDIRDGQLRINQTGSFRVHLLNTMDRDIVAIHLDIDSDQFEATVKPSPTWKGHPRLKTARQGGTKEYYEVELKRKAGTADGKYKIGLKLTGGRNSGQVFKTLDLNEAMAILQVPRKPAGLAVDGKAQRTEWIDALLCEEMHESGRDGRYDANKPAQAPTRFRLASDAANLYCLLSASDLGQKDVAHFHFAPDVDTKAQTVTVDLKAGKVVAPAGAAGLQCRAVEGGGLELQIPLASVGLAGKKSFLLNLARDRDGVVSCLSGTPASSDNPVAFPTAVLAN